MNTKITSTVAVFCMSIGLAAGSAQAQVFGNSNAASDAVDANQDQAREDINQSNRDSSFGNDGRRLGWYGSVSGTASATSGNTETFDVGVGAKFGNYDGTNGHDFRLSLTYGESAGVKTDSKFLMGYDYTRNLNDRTFAFGKLNTINDEFGSYTSDSFLGFGIGYRVVDTAKTRWSVQAGPGYRVAEDAAGLKIEEAAVAVSSKYYQGLSASAFLTNDTDILSSDADTVVTNELGVSTRLSDSLALRTSLQTTYHSNPTPGLKSTDNTLGVSVVYNFN